jgi:hypothetical protein
MLNMRKEWELFLARNTDALFYVTSAVQSETAALWIGQSC